jgi:hypothetical protein
MVVADDKRHTIYAECVKALKELTPVRLALAHRDASADDPTLAVVVDADGDEDRTGHYCPAKPNPFVPGVEHLDNNSELTQVTHFGTIFRIFGQSINRKC